MAADNFQSILLSYLAQTRENAVIVLNPEGVIVGWLAAASQILGYSAEEMVGRSLTAIFTASDRRTGIDNLELEIARTKGRSQDDRWHVRKDGSRIWVTGSVDSVHDEQGNLLGFVKVLRDRTDLRTRLDTSEHQLAESQAALQRTHTFLRTLGHEMRNPLSPIQQATAILEKTTADPRAKKALKIIDRQVASLTRMADDLVEASRLEAGKVQLKLQTEDLCEFLRDTTEEHEQEAEDKGVKLILALPVGKLLVQIDKFRFHQVAANLLRNAIKYTPSDGRIWVKATQEGSEVVMRVEDTGMGIGPEMLPRLFQLFSRGQSAQEVAPSGLGVGLAVVREVVELHGGTVQARSPGVGKGSEFTVRLPAPDSKPDAPASAER